MVVFCYNKIKRCDMKIVTRSRILRNIKRYGFKGKLSLEGKRYNANMKKNKIPFQNRLRNSSLCIRTSTL